MITRTVLSVERRIELPEGWRNSRRLRGAKRAACRGRKKLVRARRRGTLPLAASAFPPTMNRHFRRSRP